MSGGEKSAFDILLDLIIKASYYEDAIYCIDEPETHMHTRLQSLLFAEIYNLIPGNSQLWVNTHSFGMLKKSKGIRIAFSWDNSNSKF
ncbi:MAG: AAA family ATPase [Bacteroidota bacterium]